MAARHGLGKGLDALIPDTAKTNTLAGGGEAASVDGNAGAAHVNITKVEPNRDQPRKHFDEDALAELADSIRQFGLLQPVLVQDRGTYYQIIAGERRWRAAKKAGLKEIPVIIGNYTDQEIIEISLIENIQREDLNPIEEAHAFRRLLTEFHLKQEDIAERVSKSRAAIANSVRLLKLCDEVQHMVVTEMISTGHARALITIEDKKQQYALAQKIFDQKLSVREVEKMVKKIANDVAQDKPQAGLAGMNRGDDTALAVIYHDIAESLKNALGTKVTIQPRGAGAGKIEIEFYSHDDLDRIIEQLT